MISTIIKDNAANYNGSISSISNSYNFYIGNRYTGGNLSAGGYMDEFAQWNRALTQEEVTAIYNLGTGIYY